MPLSSLPIFHIWLLRQFSSFKLTRHSNYTTQHNTTQHNNTFSIPFFFLSATWFLSISLAFFSHLISAFPCWASTLSSPIATTNLNRQETPRRIMGSHSRFPFGGKKVGSDILPSIKRGSDTFTSSSFYFFSFPKELLLFSLLLPHFSFLFLSSSFFFLLPFVPTRTNFPSENPQLLLLQPSFFKPPPSAVGALYPEILGAQRYVRTGG